MKTLISTTAIVLGLAFPTAMAAQTATTTVTSGQPATGMPGFLATRSPSDLFASDLMGHDVHARRTPATMTDGGNGTARSADGTPAMAMMTRADLDRMDNIGQINDIVLSSDGQVRAIVIGIGGFLGMGEQDVAVTMDQVAFAADADDRSILYVVVNTGADMLKASPRYERVAITGNDGAPAAGRTAFVAPKIDRDGYDRVAVTEVSSEMLVGKPVYGVNDDAVGTIDDLIVDDKGAISDVIIDFGGFLGLGASQVSVGFDELTILANDGQTDLRVYVDATKEQVQAQPQYRPMN